MLRQIRASSLPAVQNYPLTHEDGEGLKQQELQGQMDVLHPQAGRMGCPGRTCREAPQHLSALRLPASLVPFMSHQPLRRLPVIPAHCCKKDGGGMQQLGSLQSAPSLLAASPPHSLGKALYMLSGDVKN